MQRFPITFAHPEALTGEGRMNLGGVEVFEDLDTFARRLALYPVREWGWWSSHIWTDNCRARDPEIRKRLGCRGLWRWQGASGIIGDLDYYVGTKKAPLPSQVAEKFVAHAGAKELPGNLGHISPHGLRIYQHFLAPIHGEGEAVLDLFEGAATGFTAQLHLRLKELGFPMRCNGDGLHVDRMSLDINRLVFRPNSIVDGVPRSAEVLVWRPEGVPATSLVPGNFVRERVWIQEEILEASRARKRAGAAASAFRAAADRYLMLPRAAYPKHTKGSQCPLCLHRDCFHALAADPAIWVCFSTGHRDAHGGRAGGWSGTRCHWGDALDLDSAVYNVEPADLLRLKGLLQRTRTK